MKYDIFISYRREGGYDTAKHLNDLLVRDGYKVSFDIDTLRSGDFDTQLLERIDQCKDFIRILNPNSSSRYELTKAIRDNRSLGKSAPNIIPFASQESLIDLIAEDEALSSLSMCNIQKLNGTDIEQKSDEILKRVLTQLMTPGSIKVLVENFSHDGNAKEAGFLKSLLRKYNNEHILKSESGLFFIDESGIAQRFEPAEDNPFEDDDSDYTVTKIHKSIRTLIIPKGVKGFVSDFMRSVRVTERFELPEGLISIGNNSFDIGKEQHCVFANCILPTVIIPQSVKGIGNFAFGHTHIETLQLPATLRSPYGRQFKDSCIELLRLPKEWKDFVSLDNNGCLRVEETSNSNDFGYLQWPSTYVKRLEFY